MPRNCSLAIATCLVWLLLTPAAHADLLVIVHPDNPVQELTAREVSDLYLGRRRGIGTLVSPAIYELPADSPLRENFFRALNGMPVSQLNAYWARLRFSGEVLPPVALADTRAVLKAVSSDRNAIGYVDASAATGSTVKIVLRLKE